MLLQFLIFSLNISVRRISIMATVDMTKTPQNSWKNLEISFERTHVKHSHPSPSNIGGKAMTNASVTNDWIRHSIL